MSVLQSGEDYLEAILMLSQDKKEIHAIDVVNILGYSKPSVSIALKKLKEEGYITIDECNHLHLTDSGMAIATKIYERHIILSKILINLGIDEKVAEEDACKIEHVLSDATWDALKKHYYTNLEKK